MTSEESERLLQEAEERLRKKREVLAGLRRTEGLGETVAAVANEVASAGAAAPETETTTPAKPAPGQPAKRR